MTTLSSRPGFGHRPFVQGQLQDLTQDHVLHLQHYLKKAPANFSEAKINVLQHPNLSADTWTGVITPQIKTMLEGILAKSNPWGIELYDPIEVSKHIEVLRYSGSGTFPWHTDTSQQQVFQSPVRDCYTIAHEEYHENIVGEYSTPSESSNNRKLTCILSLTSDYEGGEFQIRMIDTEDIVFEQKLNFGEYVVLPAVYPHRVAPVTGGERFVCASWAEGPIYT